MSCWESCRGPTIQLTHKVCGCESILLRHGLALDSARLLTAPQRSGMEETVRGAIRMATDNDDPEKKLAWKFDLPYRGVVNQAETAKLAYLLQNRLATDLPLPSNIQRAAIPAFPDNADVYQGIIINMYNKASRKAKQASVREEGAGENATQAAVQDSPRTLKTRRSRLIEEKRKA
jgi:hypothetical protein